MSTELYEAKDIVDQIFATAQVPPERNDEIIYNMAMQHIGSLIHEMDLRGITMNEQRVRMGRKKDELISELIRLRENGTLEGPNGYERKPTATIHISQISKV